MNHVIHFSSQKERLAYLKGKYEEIVPEEAKNDGLTAKSAEKSQKSASKSEKSTSKRKKGKKNDEIQA